MQIKDQRDTRYLEFAGKLIDELFRVCDIYADPNDDQWHEKWQKVIAQRVYDIATPTEYIDRATRIRMTIEHDHPKHPRVTITCPDNGLGPEHQLTLEQVNDAVKRLNEMAGLPAMDGPQSDKDHIQ